MNIILSLLVIVVAVYFLAIITEHFFIESLDVLATHLKMPSDVAGASLMAIGSSAPELAIALIAVFAGGAHSQVGIGTIVGSAVFNILVITGASALVAGNLAVKSGSVERDVFFYLVSVVLLLFVFWNGEILWWEAVLLLAAYVTYLVVLWRWSGNNNDDEDFTPVHAHEDRSEGALYGISNLIVKVLRFIIRDPRQYYIWALVMSVLLIAALSYALVEATIVFSDAVGLSPVIVSLTLLAAGTSAPDLIASVNVASEGRGSMAIANAVGSNIFDVLVGLGLPWLIMMIFISPHVMVDTSGLIVSVFILAGTVVLLYIFLFTQRTFTRVEGVFLLLTYVAFVVYSVATG